MAGMGCSDFHGQQRRFKSKGLLQHAGKEEADRVSLDAIVLLSVLVNFLQHTHKVTLVPGDGVGKELSESVKAVFAATNAPIEWEQFDLSGHVTTNDALMKETLASLRRNKVGLKGILYTPVSRTGHTSFNVSMRKVTYIIYLNAHVCERSGIKNAVFRLLGPRYLRVYFLDQ